jgi:hypothetical protein
MAPAAYPCAVAAPMPPRPHPHAVYRIPHLLPGSAKRFSSTHLFSDTCRIVFAADCPQTIVAGYSDWSPSYDRLRLFPEFLLSPATSPFFGFTGFQDAAFLKDCVQNCWGGSAYASSKGLQGILQLE